MKKYKKYKIFYNDVFKEEITATSKKNVNEYIKDSIKFETFNIDKKFNKFKVIEL